MTHRAIVFRRLCLLALALTLWGAAWPALAQDGGQGSTTIHVVQRGETLFQIAMRYGTTVDAIAQANGIDDPRYITVGQRLLIPNVQSSDSAGTVTLHTLQPGETLETLARHYHTPPAELAAANHMTNPAQLYVGQEIAVPLSLEQGGDVEPRALYHVQTGDNLARVAVHYGVGVAALAEANTLSPSAPLFVGQTLWIPGSAAAQAPLRDLPPPFTDCELSPVPAVQGKTLSIRLQTSEYVTLSGTFLGYPVQLVTEDATQHYALFGVHAFTAAGVYPMVLTATREDGTQTTLTLRVQVVEGGYSSETISLTTEQQDLLNPQVTEPEWELFARVMSSFTARRYFDGVMGLPSSGAISSPFGTRRSYNGGELRTFHSGTDFAAPPGSPVVAPAAGVVVLAEELPVRGNAVAIDHGWGVVTAYFHLSAINVAVGDVVTAGQTIGAVGSTGRSTGPHLHWEMWVGGVQVDPMQWVQRSFP